MDVLQEVLDRAHSQAIQGKGRERHGLGLPFERQPIMTITEQVGMGFPLGQALKKIQESQVLLEDQRKPERAVRELLGAIVYLAATILFLERRTEKGPEENAPSPFSSSGRLLP